jgi:hypothetical protein
MNPIPFPQSNKTLVPSPGTEHTTRNLQVHNDGQITTSCWTLSPAELEEVQKTGRVYLQVWAGQSSPPVCASAFNPLGDYEAHMSEDEYNSHLMAGHCPWCGGKTGWRAFSGKTVDRLFAWEDRTGEKPLNAEVDVYGPMLVCSDCGCGVYNNKPTYNPIVLETVLGMMAKFSGVHRQENEDPETYEARVKDIIGAEEHARIFCEIRKALHG